MKNKFAIRVKGPKIPGYLLKDAYGAVQYFGNVCDAFVEAVALEIAAAQDGARVKFDVAPA